MYLNIFQNIVNITRTKLFNNFFRFLGNDYCLKAWLVRFFHYLSVGKIPHGKKYSRQKNHQNGNYKLIEGNATLYFAERIFGFDLVYWFDLASVVLQKLFAVSAVCGVLFNFRRGLNRANAVAVCGKQVSDYFTFHSYHSCSFSLFMIFSFALKKTVRAQPSDLPKSPPISL